MGQGQRLMQGVFCGSVWLALVGLVLVWLGGCSGLVRGLWGIVRGCACFRGCAFPLVVLSGLEFSLVLGFWAFVGVFIGVMRLNAIISVFKGLAVAPLVRVALR